MASTAALELIVKLDDKASKGMDDISKKGGGLGKVMKGMLGPAALLTGGIGVLGAGLFAAGQAAADEEVGMKRLQQTLKNSVKGYNEATGGVEDYISKQEKLAFADDELRDSLAHLVGQTGDLTEAQELQATAMDLARAKGISLEMATKAVGKVDQDSIGILKKLGIQVTENMTKEEALTAIRAQSAGQADAYAKSAAGSMEIVQNAMGNAVEDIGGLVLPALTAVISGVATFAGALGEAFKTGDFSQIGTMVAGALGGVVSWVGEMVPSLIAKLGEWAAAFIGWIVPMVPQAIGALVGFIGEIVNWIVTQAPVLVNSIIAWGQAFVDWIVPMIPIWLEQAGDFIGGILSWLQEQIPFIVTTIATWATAFVNWILDSIPLWLTAAGEFISGVLAWLGEQIGPIAAQLQAWGIAFVQWIGEAIPPLLAKLGTLAMSVIKWLGDELPGIIGKLGEWALAFVGWVLPVLGPLLVELGKILIGIGAWILTDALPGIVNMLLSWIKAFVDWVAPALAQLLTKLGELAQKIWSWIATTATDAYTKALEIGKNLVKGMWDGFLNIIPAFQADAKSGIQMIIDSMNEQAGNKSPSTKTLETGKNLVQGLINGLHAMMGLAIVATTAVAVAVLKAAHSALGTTGGASPLFQSMGQLAMAGLQKGIDDNGKLPVGAVKTQVSKLLPTAKANLGDFSSVGSAISAGVNAGINATWPGVVNNIMGKARSLAASARAALDIRSPSGVFLTIGKQVMEGLAAGITNNYGVVVTAMGGVKKALDISDPLEEMATQWHNHFEHLAQSDPLEGMTAAWAQEFDRLAEAMAMSDPFEGMTAAWQKELKVMADKLAASDPFEEMTKQWAKEFADLPSKLNATMFEGLGDPFEEMTKAWQKEFADPTEASPLDELVAGIIEGGPIAEAELITQVEKLLPAALANLGDFKSVGKAITEGITAGVNEGWDAVVKNLMDKARALAADAKAALDIHSPSGVFMRIGEQMMEGWAAGIVRGGNLVRGAIGSILPTLAPSFAGVSGGSPSSRIGMAGDVGSGARMVVLDIDVNSPASGADGRRIGQEIVRVLEDAGLHDRLVHP